VTTVSMPSLRRRPRSRPRAATAATLALIAGLLLALVGPVLGLAPAPGARAASTDLTLVTDATYELRPDGRLVHVTVRITARNNKAETRTQKFWFDRANLAVLPGITNVKLSGVKGATVQVTKRAGTYTMLRINFGSRLYSGASRVFSLSFDVKDAASTPNAQVRIGGSLASFPVWAFASDGAKGSTVRVLFPAGYTVTVDSGAFDLTKGTADGGTTLATNALSAPLTFFAYVTGQRQATYVDSPLTATIGDVPISLTMRAWADDPAWAKNVGGLFASSLPVLATEIGLPWPHADPVIVQEAESRTTGGYAGLYDPAAKRIEVAYWADHLVVIHEAAHAWFNGSLLADRWANEGFASLYASRAAAAMGETDTSPALTDEIAKAKVPLNAWAATSSANNPTVETYGYAASLALARAIAERAGDDALRRVWADAAAGTGAYQPPADPATGAATATEPGAGPPDWRSLLDLLEAEAGQDFTDLWRTWVVREDEAALLDARAGARTSYQRTLALASGWALPRSIRDALRAWQFDTAESLMADARTVLAQRSAVEKRAALDGLQPPPAMRVAFEGGLLADASSSAEAELNALLSLEGATAKRPVDPDIITQVGLMGAEPDADLAAARTAFEAGELDTTLTGATAASATWAAAWQEGRRRALFAVAAFATVLVVVTAIAGGIRRARRGRRIPPA
jgi:hypothetical protein